MRHCQMPLVCASSGTSMRTRYMWYSSGEVWPASTRWRASSLRRRSSTACLVDDFDLPAGRLDDMQLAALWAYIALR